MITNCFVQKGDTRSDKDLIYMKPLDYVLQRVLDWYWDSGKTILDVTAGKKMIWNSIKDNLTIKGEKVWNVTFFDYSKQSEAEIIGSFHNLPFKDNSFDLIVFDPPFIKPESGIENIGIKTHKTPDRLFYFRQNEWIPPEEQFRRTFEEFNRVSRNGLLVKMAERFQGGYEVPVYTEMDLAYDYRYNSKSKFQRCCRISYRGKRAGLGMKSIHPQRVLSSYTVYKKDRKIR